MPIIDDALFSTNTAMARVLVTAALTADEEMADLTGVSRTRVLVIGLKTGERHGLALWATQLARPD